MERLTKDEIHNLVEIARIVKRIKDLKEIIKYIKLLNQKDFKKYLEVHLEIVYLEELLDSRLEEIK